LPFEIACADSLDEETIAAAGPLRTRIGEIFRLTVIAQYRRCLGESTRAFSLEEESVSQNRVRLPT
jgi:hypothetical protein